MKTLPGTARYALIVDDHPLYSRGLAELLMAHKLVEHAYSASSATECQSLIAAHGAPAIMIVDFWLAEGATIELVTSLKTNNQLDAVIMISADDDPAVANKARECAKGFLHKQASTDTFLKAAKHVMEGGTWYSHEHNVSSRDVRSREIPITSADLGLSARQGQILAMVLQGLPNKRIAQTLSLSESTIKEHITGILHKLLVSNRVEAIAKLRGYRITE